MKTLEELFEQQIIDLYSAETQIIEFLPILIKNSTDLRLKSGFQAFLKETIEQKKRLDKICMELKLHINNLIFYPMKGLIDETKKFISLKSVKEVMDAGLLDEFQRIVHFQIAGYTTVVLHSKNLELDNIMGLLRHTLDKKYGEDDRLSDIDNDESSELYF